MGIHLGMASQFRAVLRGILVGAFEGAGYAALNETLDRQHALSVGFGLVYINLVLFWFGHLTMSVFCDIALISEARWQTGTLRREFLSKDR
jgi:hypothetical protein